MQPILAEIRNYDDLHKALRQRAQSLNITCETIDLVSGLCGGYAAKILAPKPIRNIGPTSMGLLLPALGIKLLVVEDAQAMLQYARHHVARKPGPTRASSAVQYTMTRRFLREIGRKGGIASGAARRRRKAAAQRAARARWAAARGEMRGAQPAEAA
jgi:hypothetical protein